jgi:hypothetical protein
MNMEILLVVICLLILAFIFLFHSEILRKLSLRMSLSSYTTLYYSSKYYIYQFKLTGVLIIIFCIILLSQLFTTTHHRN